MGRYQNVSFLRNGIYKLALNRMCASERCASACRVFEKTKRRFPHGSAQACPTPISSPRQPDAMQECRMQLPSSVQPNQAPADCNPTVSRPGSCLVVAGCSGLSLAGAPPDPMYAPLPSSTPQVP